MNRRYIASIVTLLLHPVLTEAQSAKLKDRLPLGRQLFQIGTEDEDSNELFGSTTAAAFDKAGRLFVLDDSDNTVRVFSATGKYVGKLGRTGRGPGDLTTPSALVHDGDSLLYILDAVNGVVTFKTGATEFTHLRTFGPELRPRSACLLNGQLLVAGYRDGRQVHFIKPGGEIERSIGEPFPIESPPDVPYKTDTVRALIDYANSGAPARMACLPTLGTIVTAQLQGPAVRAYSPDGALRWSITLPGYEGHKFWIDAKKNPVVVFGSDATFSAIPIGERQVLIQVSRRVTLPGRGGVGRTMRTDQVFMTTYLIDAETGTIVAQGRDLTRVLAVAAGRLAEAETDPFPRVRVRAMVAVRTTP